MIAHVLVYATALLLGGDAAASKAQKADTLELLPIEKNIVSYTNYERALYGLPPLEVNAGLMQSARQHATWMTLNQCLVHTNQPVAENIAMGQPDSREAVESWMGSSGHRANILGGYRHVGVAAYRTADGTIFWCQQFLP